MKNNDLIELILSTDWDKEEKETFTQLIETKGMNEEQKEQLINIIEDEKRKLDEIDENYRKDIKAIEWEYKWAKAD